MTVDSFSWIERRVRVRVPLTLICAAVMCSADVPTYSPAWALTLLPTYPEVGTSSIIDLSLNMRP